MKRLQRLLLLAALVAAATDIRAQVPTTVRDNDLRGRVEAAFEASPVKNLSLTAGVQLRLSGDMSDVDRLHTSLGAQYRVCPWFKVGADYILINRRDGIAAAWHKPRHRLNVNLSGSCEVGRVELALRERIQTTFRTDSVNRYEAADPAVVLRSRLTATWNLRKSKCKPYLLFELYNTLNAPAVVENYLKEGFSHDNYVTRVRCGIGAKYKLSRRHRLDLYYYFDYNREYDIDYKANRGDLKGYVLEKSLRHIIGISYKFKL